MNKKAAAQFVIGVLALIILAFLIVNIATRECNKNSECNNDSYCGSDYECHKYPDKIIVKKNTFLLPAIILGTSLIVAAYIFRRKKDEKN